MRTTPRAPQRTDHRPPTTDAHPLTPTTDEPDHTPDWRTTARRVMLVAAGGCVIALGLLTLDVPGLIIVAVMGIPAAWSVYQCIQTLVVHEAQLDAQLAAWQARRAARRPIRPAPAYTGDTVKLDEVPQ